MSEQDPLSLGHISRPAVAEQSFAAVMSGSNGSAGSGSVNEPSGHSSIASSSSSAIIDHFNEEFKSPLTPAPSPTAHHHYSYSNSSSPNTSSHSPNSRNFHQLQQEWNLDESQHYNYHLHQLRSRRTGGGRLDSVVGQDFPSAHDDYQKESSTSKALSLVESVRSQFGSLDDEGRSLFLGELLAMCGRAVLSETLDYISPMLKRDPMVVLPSELALKVLSYVDDPLSLARASQVSKTWYLMISDDLTWKELCKTHHFRRLSAAVNVAMSGDNLRGRVPSVVGVNSGIHPGTVVPGSSPTGSVSGQSDLTEAFYNPNATKRPVPTSYRSHFKQQYLLNSAWASGGRLAAKYVISIPGVVTSLLMEGQYIVIALDNSKIFVFREDGRLLRALFGHVMGVWALALRGHTLVSGGCDRDVRVWDLRSGGCSQILKGHSSTVRCLQMVDEDTAISGSRDATIRIWDVKKGICKRVLEGHDASVRCVEVHGDICVSGSYDFTAKVWRISDGTLLHTLVGHISQIYSLAFDGKRIATGSLDASIRIWDPETGLCLAFLQGHTSLVGQLQMKGNILVSGGSDGAIRVWDLENYTCLQRFTAHDNSVTTLQFDEERIVSGGSDGKVEVWELATGKHIRSLSGPFDAVWRVAFKDEKIAILASRQNMIHMELMSFTPTVDRADSTATPPTIEFRSTDGYGRRRGHSTKPSDDPGMSPTMVPVGRESPEHTMTDRPSGTVVTAPTAAATPGQPRQDDDAMDISA
ncbi:SCF ubiquitin ligase complex subunit CDC4 [Sugiyamaella lignohabitans]|uniref:SCF ubiquitin ligase complex subunit CDC4 n=1 Tax=Sugiyamaella lignohabitans TaxID=796027 RepID=A0A167C056_9ASCO|nr:SCF ubiquitin ligase complex subunit CDC4 [Sugiyamaella lignohabitans]ANB11049.1 SCF ubiquitin ligase complex subunit CDC4 [Sugiyamaella lignohabitans]